MSIVLCHCQRHQSRTTSHHSDISRGNGPRCKRTDRWVLVSVMLLPNHAVNIQTAHCLFCCCQTTQLISKLHIVCYVVAKPRSEYPNCTLSVLLLPNQAVNIQTAHCLLCCCQDKQLHIKHCLSDFAMLSVWFHGPVAHKPRARIHTAAHIHGWSYPDYHINAHIQSSNPKLISTAAHINSWSYHQLLISISKRLKCYTMSMCCILSCKIQAS